MLRLIGLQDAPCDSAESALFGTVSVLVEPTGSHTLQRVTLSAGAADPRTVDQPPFVVPLDTTVLEDGTVNVVATAEDSDGDSLGARVQVCVDNGGPAVELLTPAEGAVVGLQDAQLTARVSVSDPAGVDQVTAQLVVGASSQGVSCEPPGATQLECLLHPGELALTLAAGSQSPMTLIVTARDHWGRETRRERKLQLNTRLLWSYYTGGAISWGALPLAGGKVAVANDNGSVHVLDASGSKVCEWTAPPVRNKADGVATPLAAGDGPIIFFATTQGVHALDTSSCTASWSTPGGLYFASRPAHDPISGRLYVGSYGALSTPGRLQVFNAASGQLLGTHPIAPVDEAVTAGPTLSADGSTVYIGSSDFALHAVDVTKPAQMTSRWTYATGAKVESPALVTANRIVLAGLDKTIHAVDPVTGHKDPGFNFTAQAGFMSAPVLGPDGTLYAGSLDLQLYALDSQGGVKATYETGRMMRASPAIGPGGVVFAVRTEPGELYALTPGLKLLWSLRPGVAATDQLKGTPAVQGQRVFVGSTNGYLYALDATPPSS